MKNFLSILFIFILSFWFLWISKAADLTKLKSFINIIVSNKKWDTTKLNELKWNITSTLVLAREKTKDLPATNEKKKDLLEILAYFLAKVDDAIKNPDNSLAWWDVKVPNSNNGKTPFNWKYVKVDGLWNVKVNGKSFFPMCIYWSTYWVGGSPSKLAAYKSRWFNCVVLREAEHFSKVKAAWMKVMLQTSLDAWKFENNLKYIKDNWLNNTLLFYYSDYEQWNVWNWGHHKTKKDLIARYDPNWHPHYYLNWTTWDAVWLYNAWVSNITGSYVYERWASFKPNWPEKIIELENWAQKQPVVMAQLNFWVWWASEGMQDPIWRRMTPIAMASVAAWAKWLGYWRDWAGGWANWRRPIESQWFWNDLPKFKSDINKMMNAWLLQQSHRSFATKCTWNLVYWWTRKLNWTWYLIVANWGSWAQNVSCSVTNLWYTIKSVEDFLKWWSWWSWNWSSVTINVPAYWWKVVKLTK